MYVDYGSATIASKDSYISITILNDSVYENQLQANSIFPNPANDMIHILSDFTISLVRIYTSTGILLFEQQVNANVAQVPVQSLQNGAYIVQTRGNGHNYGYKLQIRH